MTPQEYTHTLVALLQAYGVSGPEEAEQGRPREAGAAGPRREPRLRREARLGDRDLGAPRRQGREAQYDGRHLRRARGSRRRARGRRHAGRRRGAEARRTTTAAPAKKSKDKQAPKTPGTDKA
jgi:hypothetical protein